MAYCATDFGYDDIRRLWEPEARQRGAGDSVQVCDSSRSNAIGLENGSNVAALATTVLSPTLRLSAPTPRSDPIPCSSPVPRSIPIPRAGPGGLAVTRVAG